MLNLKHEVFQFCKKLGLVLVVSALPIMSLFQFRVTALCHSEDAAFSVVFTVVAADFRVARGIWNAVWTSYTNKKLG